ncbi:hypothetical protein Tco_1467705 [Tanacetum coccineum]
MSDSKDSTVTYTEVSSPFEDLSDIGSLRAIVHVYDGLPMMSEDPYVYVVAAFQAPPSPDYVPGPEELEQEPPSPAFVPEHDPEEEDPADYPTDRDDDEEEESFGDDADEEDEDEDEDDEEDEEHLAPADSVPPPTYQVDRLLAISTPPSSPLTSYSSPLPQIPSSPLPASSPLPISPSPLPASPTHPLGYRAAMIRLRAELPYISHPLPIILPHTRAFGHDEERGGGCGVGECSSAPTARPTGGFRADYGFVGTLDAKIRRDPDREIGYGITDVWVDPDEIAEEIPVTDVAELGQRMTDFVMTVRYDAQDDRSLMSGQLNFLCRDRRAHARTARLMKSG